MFLLIIASLKWFSRCPRKKLVYYICTPIDYFEIKRLDLSSNIPYNLDCFSKKNENIVLIEKVNFISNFNSEDRTLDFENSTYKNI